MALNERQGPLRFLIPLAIVLLVVYCVSLGVFLVYMMRDHNLFLLLRVCVFRVVPSKNLLYKVGYIFEDLAFVYEEI